MPQPNTREQPCPPAVTRNRSDFSQRSSRLHSWFTVPLTESFLPFLLASAISATSLKAEVSRSRQTTSLSPMLYTACLSHGHHANSGSSPTSPNFVTTSSMYQARRMWWQMLCPGRPPSYHSSPHLLHIQRCLLLHFRWWALHLQSLQWTLHLKPTSIWPVSLPTHRRLRVY